MVSLTLTALKKVLGGIKFKVNHTTCHWALMVNLTTCHWALMVNLTTCHWALMVSLTTCHWTSDERTAGNIRSL
jgi:hypothetical protein